MPDFHKKVKFSTNFFIWVSLSFSSARINPAASNSALPWNSYTRFLARQRRQSRQLHLTIEYWHFDFYLYVRRQLQFWFPVSFYSYLAPFLTNQHCHTGNRHTDGLCLKIRAYRYSLTCRRFLRPHPTTSDASHTCIFAGDLRRNLLPRR